MKFTTHLFALFLLPLLFVSSPVQAMKPQIANDQSKQVLEDTRYMSFAVEEWMNEAYNSDPQPTTTAVFIKLSKDILDQYRSGKRPLPQDVHSKKIEGDVLYLLEQMLRVYAIAGIQAKSFEDFLQITSDGLSFVRNTIQSCSEYSQVRASIQKGVNTAISKISKGSGIISELQFVYVFKYQWEQDIINTETSNPPKSGKEYISLAKAALERIKKQGHAPTVQANDTAIYTVSKIIELFDAENNCATNLKDFLKLNDQFVEPIYEAIDQGITQNKSLDGIRHRITEAVDVAVRKLKSCKK